MLSVAMSWMNLFFTDVGPKSKSQMLFLEKKIYWHWHGLLVPHWTLAVVNKAAGENFALLLLHVVS